MNALLEIRDLHVSFGDTPVLKGVKLTVPAGASVGITGPNGSGKSTLLKAVCRKIRENSGSVTFAGMNLCEVTPHRLVQGWGPLNGSTCETGISTLWQSSLVFPSLTVEEHLWLALDMNGDNNKKQRLDAIYNEFKDRDLFSLRRRRGGNLSGGQRRLLSLALLLAHNNCCWLLDEPFAGLDSEAAAFSVEWLLRKQKGGVTLLTVAHETEKIAQLCPTVWAMRDGLLEPY